MKFPGFDEFLAKVKAGLLKHGVPQEVVDKIDVISGHAMGIAAMLVTDGKAAVIKFINDEWQKVKDEITKA